MRSYLHKHATDSWKDLPHYHQEKSPYEHGTLPSHLTYHCSCQVPLHILQLLHQRQKLDVELNALIFFSLIHTQIYTERQYFPPSNVSEISPIPQAQSRLKSCAFTCQDIAARNTRGGGGRRWGWRMGRGEIDNSHEGRKLERE